MTHVYLRGGGVTFIDTEDLPKIEPHYWSKDRHGYAVAYLMKPDKKMSLIMMHRLIMNPPKELMIDHINRNPLVNMKKNMRFATRGQNNHNQKDRAGRLPQGIHLTPTGKYAVKIGINKKSLHIGTALTIESAVAMRAEASKRIYGDL